MGIESYGAGNGEDAARSLGEARLQMEAISEKLSPMETLRDDVADEAFRMVVESVAMPNFSSDLMGAIGVESPLDKFSATDCARGVMDGLNGIPSNLYNSSASVVKRLAYYGTSGVDSVASDVRDFANNIGGETSRMVLKMKYIIEDLLAYMEESNYVDVSYMIGRALAIVLVMFLMKGAVNSSRMAAGFFAKTPALSKGFLGAGMGLKAAGTMVQVRRGTDVLAPETQMGSALANPAMVLSLASHMIPDEVDESEDPRVKMAMEILRDLQRRMKTTQDLVEIKKFTDACDDLYLYRSNPHLHPLPKDSMDFLRENFVDSYRNLMIAERISSDNFELAILGLLYITGSHTAAALKGISESERSTLLLYKPGADEILNRLPLEQLDKDGLRVALIGVRKDLDAGHAPNPQLVDRILSIFEKDYLRRTKDVRGEA